MKTQVNELHFFWKLYPFKRWLVLDKDGRKSYRALFAVPRTKFVADQLCYEIQVDGVPQVVPFMDVAATGDFAWVKLPSKSCRLVMVKGKRRVLYRFSQRDMATVRAGQEFGKIDGVPVDMLRAMAANQDFLFSPDAVCWSRSPERPYVDLNSRFVKEKRQVSFDKTKESA